MKVNEVVTSESGFYTIFSEVFPEKYALFYDEIEAADLDMQFFYKYGNKTVSSFIEANSSNLKAPVKLIISMHLKQWEKAYNALLKEYDFTSPYKRTTAKTGTDETTTKTDDTNTNKNMAFQSTEFVDNEQDVVDGKKVATTVYGNNVDISGNIGNKSFPELLSEEMETIRFNLYNIIENDIVKDTTLPIYESEDN